MKYHWWALIAWGLWVVSFFALEFWFLWDADQKTPPLTHVLTSVPGWLLFFLTGGLFGWLIWHWKATYEDREDGEL